MSNDWNLGEPWGNLGNPGTNLGPWEPGDRNLKPGRTWERNPATDGMFATALTADFCCQPLRPPNNPVIPALTRSFSDP